MGTPILDQLSNLNGDQFEELCSVLLDKTGFRNIVRRKSGTQSGRDIDADGTNPNSAENEHWYFECKGYRTGSTVPFKEIVTKFLLVQRLAPQPDALVVLCSSQLSNDANDYIDSFAADLDFPILRVTNEPPTMLFDQWVLAHQDTAIPLLDKISPTDRDTATPTVKLWDHLWREKEHRQRPTARTERSLKLNAFPKLTFSYGGGAGHYQKVKGHIKNVGNGFADSIHLLLLHQGVTVYERDLTALAAGSSHEVEARMNVDQSIGKRLGVGASDPLTIVLTYKNALNYSLQSSYTLTATKASTQWNYGPVLAL